MAPASASSTAPRRSSSRSAASPTYSRSALKGLLQLGGVGDRSRSTVLSEHDSLGGAQAPQADQRQGEAAEQCHDGDRRGRDRD